MYSLLTYIIFYFRSFLTKSYPVIKKYNPTLPVLIREAANVKPTAYARFEFGREAKASLEGLDSKGIESAIIALTQGK